MEFLSRLCGKKDTASKKENELLKADESSIEESAAEHVKPKTEEKATTNTVANGFAPYVARLQKLTRGICASPAIIRCQILKHNRHFVCYFFSFFQ